MKKITLASFFCVLLVFAINVNASTSLGWDDTPLSNGFERETDKLYDFNKLGMTVASDLDTDVYLNTYASLESSVFSVDPVVSDSIISDGVSDFKGANVNLTTEPLPLSVWLVGSAVLGIGGLASRRKSLPG